jgi:Mn-dependent DtxR family transcriptional regulator
MPSDFTYETYATLSRFFEDVLELEDYEREAMELAGNISPVVAKRLASTLLPDDVDTTCEAEITVEIDDGGGPEEVVFAVFVLDVGN